MVSVLRWSGPVVVCWLSGVSRAAPLMASGAVNAIRAIPDEQQQLSMSVLSARKAGVSVVLTDSAGRGGEVLEFM